MFSTYLDCAISIGALGPDGYPLAVRGPGGDARATIAPFQHDPEYRELSAHFDRLDFGPDLIDRAGQWLFRQLFHGPIKDVYARGQGLLRDGQGLRVTLHIDEGAPELSELPWELLHDPDQGPLALLDVSVVRYLPHQSAPPALKTELPLKVLLTGAQTAADDPIEASLHAAEDALKHLGDYVQITIEPHLSMGKLQQLLRQDFHVWHFVGRAGMAPNGAAQLLLESAQQSQPINAQQLLILLKRSGVRLVLLDTIGTNTSSLMPLRQLAAAVVRAQVPAAIATQFSSPGAVARAFNYEFYRALAEEFPIDACVTEGRKAVMSEVGLDQFDWASPVVYTRAPDGKLFELPVAPAPDLSDRIVRPPDEIWHGAAVAVHQADGVLLYASGTPKIERLEQKPRPPRRVRGFVGREQELSAIRRELAPGGGAWVSGPQGCGLSTLLRQAANLPEAAELSDGVAYIDGAAEPPHADDIVHRLFERFYTATPPVKLPPASARTALGSLQALFALDTLPLNPAELRQMTDLFADGAVLVGADGSGPNTLLRVPIGGLGEHEAIAVHAGEAQIDQAEVGELLQRLAAGLGRLPLPVLLAARLTRWRLAQAGGSAADVLAEFVQAIDQMEDRDPLVRALRLMLSNLGESERAAARALAAVQGPDAELAALAAAAGLPPSAALAALSRLGELGLAEGQGDRFTIGSGSVRRAIDQIEPCAAERSRLALYYAEVVGASQPLRFERATDLRRVALESSQRGDRTWIVRERANLMAATETLLADNRPAEAGLIARALQWALATRGLWDSWQQLAELALQAARALGDRTLEAWALHERGTRAGLLRNLDTARADLSAARQIRIELGDQRGAAASLHNMSYLELLPPAPVLTPTYRRGWRFLWIIIGMLLALVSVYGASAATGFAPSPGNLIALAMPTATATPAPTNTPTATATPAPSGTPTPSSTPTPSASPTPSVTPTPSASPTPSSTPTPSASPTPSITPTPSASPTPSITPTPRDTPTPSATLTPSPAPTPLPAAIPNKPVIAFYYAWYQQSDWTLDTMVDLPQETYDGGDTAALQRHLQQASDAGINVLACAWYGPNEDRINGNCRKLLRLAESTNVKVALFADSAAFTNLFSEDGMVEALQAIQNDWANSPAYYKVDGKPAFFAWQLEALGGAKNVDAWRRVRERADPNRAMFWFGGSVEFSYLNEFDAIVYFDITWENTAGAAMRSYLGRLKGYPGKPFVGTAMPGYDDTRNRPGSTHKVRPHDPDYYRATWNAVIKGCAQAAIITSFNEFKEGSFIEPSQQYGTTYLDITREMIQQYKGSGC